MQCQVSLGVLFLCRDKDNTAVRCQITEVLPTVYLRSAGFLARLCWKKSKPHYSLCVCGGGRGERLLQMTGALSSNHLMYNTMTGPRIGDFQINENLGHAADLGMFFIDIFGRGRRGVPIYMYW